MSNKASGTKYENKIAQKLHRQGWWVHNLQAKAGGQPADLVAIKRGVALLIDCKECKDDVFKFSRVEPNQQYAMEQWLRSGNECPLFVLGFSNDDYVIPYYAVLGDDGGINTSSSISLAKHKFELLTLDEFLIVKGW